MSRTPYPALAALLGALATAGALAAQPEGGAVRGTGAVIGASVRGAGTRPGPAHESTTRRKAPRTPDAPPPARTGGFGEPTCHECHFDGDVGAGNGALALDVPDHVPPGTTVLLTVRLAQPDMRRAGFMLSARSADGVQAGELRAVDGRVLVTLADGVAYAHHTFAGTEVAGDSTAWTVAWDTGGLTAGDVVHIHLVANAANDDASPFGDAIYADSCVVTIDEG